MARNSVQLLANAIAKRYKISNADAIKFVSAIFDIITDELKNNNQVKIKGLGTFKMQSVKPRESVNVNTGERVLIEEHDKISFTPDATMKDLVNKPFAQFETVVLNEGVEFENDFTEDSSQEKETNSESEDPNSENLLTEETPDKIVLEEDMKKEEIKPSSLPTEDEVVEQEEEKNVTNIEENENIFAKIDIVEEDEVPTEDERDMRTLWRTLIVIVVIAVVGFGGYYVKKYFDKQAIKEDSVPVRIFKPTKETAVVPPKTTRIQSNLQDSVAKNNSAISETSEEAKYANLSNDPKIRYGAYNIVGIETVVVLRRGETMESYSRKMLGPDMVGYFQVLNGVDEMHEGDTMKVPKVKYRPQYQKNK